MSIKPNADVIAPSTDSTENREAWLQAAFAKLVPITGPLWLSRPGRPPCASSAPSALPVPPTRCANYKRPLAITPTHYPYSCQITGDETCVIFMTAQYNSTAFIRAECRPSAQNRSIWRYRDESARGILPVSWRPCWNPHRQSA